MGPVGQWYGIGEKSARVTMHQGVNRGEKWLPRSLEALTLAKPLKTNDRVQGRAGLLHCCRQK